MARRLWPSVAALVLLPATAVLAGNVSGRTLSLLQDRSDAATLVHAAAGAITVTPDTWDLGTFWVGDKCTDVSVATVSTVWPVDLSVTASGWLGDADVAITPASIGPGETATVMFTNAAVNGPTDFFEAVITVHGSPGNLEQVFRLTGRVENPAEPGAPPPVLPEGCVHPANKPKAHGQELLPSCEEPVLADRRLLEAGDLPEEEAPLCNTEGAPAPAPEAPAPEAPA